MSKIRTTTIAETLARARSQIGGPVKYKLGAGGRDPFDDDPASTEPGEPMLSDCIGFVCWALGMDRRQAPEDFPTRGGWCNTDSMLDDAEGRKVFFVEPGLGSLAPRPGDLVVYRSEYVKKVRKHAGHVGIITKVPKGWDYLMGNLSVIHCSSGNDRRLGYAIAETTGKIWEKRGKIVRYKLHWAEVL
jgi:hypothetical protein